MASMSTRERFWEVVCPYKDLAKAGLLLSLVFLVLAVAPLLTAELSRAAFVVTVVNIVLLTASALGFGAIQYRCNQRW